MKSKTPIFKVIFIIIFFEHHQVKQGLDLYFTQTRGLRPVAAEHPDTI